MYVHKIVFKLKRILSDPKNTTKKYKIFHVHHGNCGILESSKHLNEYFVLVGEALVNVGTVCWFVSVANASLVWSTVAVVFHVIVEVLCKRFINVEATR